MTTIIIIGVLALALIITILIISSKSKKLKEAKKTADLEKHKKQVLKKSIDNILLHQKDNNNIEKQTAKHVEILRGTKDEKVISKELTILRDNIFAEYSQLRND